MRVLVTGSGGQVGFELMRAAWPAGLHVEGLTRQQLDIADATAVRGLSGYDLIVNAAGYTAVDKAESESAAAFRANRDGPAALAATGIPLIHLSTDYVFDGRKIGAYTDDDPLNPLGVYANSKVAGEAAIRSGIVQHIILRTSWLYGAHGNNFVKTMLRLASQRTEIAVIDDQRGAPTAAADLAAAVVTIVRHVATGTTAWGTYHYSATGVATWCGFAQRIFKLRAAGMPQPTIRPVRTPDYPTPARRPVNSRLDCRRTEATFGVLRYAWQESLEQYLPEIEANLT